MIAPEDLTERLLIELIGRADVLAACARRALNNSHDAIAAELVCARGAEIAQLLGITAGVAGTDPPSTPLIDVSAGDDSETLDMDVED